MSNDDNGDLFELATEGTDPEWFDATGDCGGCGSKGCHEGRCVGDLCEMCADRHGEGWPR